MKLSLLVGGVAVVGLVVAVLFMRPDAMPGEEMQTPVEHADVTLTELGFVPRSLTLKLHGTISFSTTLDKPFWPASDIHPDHGIYPEFDPGKPLHPGETWAFTFERTGRFNMHDHLRSYFTGTIYVVE